MYEEYEEVIYYNYILQDSSLFIYRRRGELLTRKKNQTLFFIFYVPVLISVCPAKCFFYFFLSFC